VAKVHEGGRWRGAIPLPTGAEGCALTENFSKSQGKKGAFWCTSAAFMNVSGRNFAAFNFSF